MERRKFTREFKLEAVRLIKERGVARNLAANEEQPEIISKLGTAGFLARAFVFTMIGLFLLFAADSRSSEAKGFAGALRIVQHQPYGSFLLGITAAGLLAFGLYGVAEAVYRRITPPSRREWRDRFYRRG
jgi:hypothetical protein